MSNALHHPAGPRMAATHPASAGVAEDIAMQAAPRSHERGAVPRTPSPSQEPPVSAGAAKPRSMTAPSIGSMFAAAAHWTSLQCGRASTFAIAVGAIAVWAASGPIFGFSDTWQLVINTGTTIITFLMVFLIQNTQNRDSAVLHLKLDELIRVNENARNRLLDLEGLSEEELERLKSAFSRLAQSPPDRSLLREAVEDLEGAGQDIRTATTKIEAAAKR